MPAGVLAVRVEVVEEGQLPDPLLRGPAVEEELRVDAPVGGRDHGGAPGEAGDGPVDAPAVRDAVGLVQDDEVGEGQVPVDLGVPGAGGVELGGVHDLDQAAVDDARVLAGEHHPHELLRLGQTAGLDDDDVDAGGGAGEAVEVAVQFADVDGAAQAAVAERDRGVAERPGHRHGVDLDGPEVVDDRSEAAAAAAVEEVVQQGRLAGAEETGEDDDRDLLGARLTQRATSFTPMRAPVRGPAPRTRPARVPARLRGLDVGQDTSRSKHLGANGCWRRPWGTHPAWRRDA